MLHISCTRRASHDCANARCAQSHDAERAARVASTPRACTAPRDYTWSLAATKRGSNVSPLLWSLRWCAASAGSCMSGVDADPTNGGMRAAILAMPTADRGANSKMRDANSRLPARSPMAFSLLSTRPGASPFEPVSSFDPSLLGISRCKPRTLSQPVACLSSPGPRGRLVRTVGAPWLGPV